MASSGRAWATGVNVGGNGVAVGGTGMLLRNRHCRPVDAQVHELRVDPAALLVHAAELDPGGAKAVAAVAGDDVEAARPAATASMIG